MKFNVKDKCVALIGGGGFIGHNLALELQRLGAEVHVIDSLQVNNLGAFSNGIETNVPNREFYTSLINERLDLLRKANIPLHILDARDYAVLTRCLASIKPTTIVQLAAIAHANKANKDPYSTFDHSMRTLENALDIARSVSKHFIFFSSSMVYGNFDGEAVTEDRRCEPLGIYGALKYGGEKLVIAYNQVFDLPFTIVRPSALYGERCVSRRVGQVFIENAIRGKAITINGDGSDGLDFTYIRDLVQGLILCIGNEAATNQVFNMTYGGARTINQMADLVREYFPTIQILHEARSKLMPERGTLSVEKARTLLGYEPAYPLERGFVEYIEWYKRYAAAHPELFAL